MRIAMASGKGGTGQDNRGGQPGGRPPRGRPDASTCATAMSKSPTPTLPGSRLRTDLAGDRPGSRWSTRSLQPLRRVRRAICEFNAIACLPDKTMVFPDLCHSCGGCWLVCPHEAITPVDRPVGEISIGHGRRSGLHPGPAAGRGNPGAAADRGGQGRSRRRALGHPGRAPGHDLPRGRDPAGRRLRGAGHRTHTLRPARPGPGPGTDPHSWTCPAAW